MTRDSELWGNGQHVQGLFDRKDVANLEVAFSFATVDTSADLKQWVADMRLLRMVEQLDVTVDGIQSSRVWHGASHDVIEFTLKHLVLCLLESSNNKDKYQGTR